MTIRIALASPFTLPFYCGNSILADRLKKGLHSRGYHVSLFNTSENKPAQAVKFSPHIIHSFNAQRPYKWITQFRDLYKIPWVITLTGTDYNSWVGTKDTPFHIQKSLEEADVLVVFHGEALHILADSLPQLKHKIKIIPQGISPLTEDHNIAATRKKYRIHADHIVFLMVSGIRPVKNIQCAIDAFYQIENHIPKVTLLHVGPVFDRAEADRVLYQGKKAKCFRYLGELSPKDIRELMGASDVFLNTSFHEGMSCAILEAMAEGLPVLASNGAGNRSLVQEGINGLCFPVDDRKALVHSAIRLARDSLLRKNMGKASKHIIADYHSEKKEMDLYEDIYKRLLQKK
ncbi:MAG: glycosyltransferase [Thermodesulfobacteriota bacterium]|nr:glycosyltransferase [Thermodesulfobacteriota bacterium]